jgi:hypothetical protein
MPKKCECDYAIKNYDIHLQKCCEIHLVESILDKYDIDSVTFGCIYQDHNMNNLLKNIPNKIKKLCFYNQNTRDELIFPQHITSLHLNSDDLFCVDNLPPNLETFIFDNDIYTPWNRKIDNLPLTLRTFIFHVEGFGNTFDLLPPNLEFFILSVPEDNYDFKKLANLPSTIKLFGLNSGYRKNTYDCTRFKYFPPHLNNFVTNFYCKISWNLFPTSMKYLCVCLNMQRITSIQINKHFSDIVKQSKNTQLQAVFYIDFYSHVIESQYMFCRNDDIWKRNEDKSYDDLVELMDDIGFGKNVIKSFLG